MPSVLAALLLFAGRPQAQESDESGEPPAVTEAELKLFIDVYGAMQSDHGLTIEKALEPHQTSIEQFRAIERRIHQQQRLVDRVRQALSDQSKARAASLAPPTPQSLTPHAP